MEAFKGVVRDMGDKSIKGEKLHRYLVIGLLVTDERLDLSKGTKGDLVIGGDATELRHGLRLIPAGKPKQSIYGLSADQVLLQLNDI